MTTATIKSILDNTYQGKVTGHKVTLSDGVVGNLNDKDSTAGLNVGDTVEVEVEDYVSKKGNHSNLLTLTKVTPTVGQSPSTPPVNIPSLQNAVVSPLSKEQAKVDASFKAMDKVIDLVLAGKVPFEQIQKNFKELCGYLYDEIESIFTEK